MADANLVSAIKTAGGLVGAGLALPTRNMYWLGWPISTPCIFR